MRRKTKHDKSELLSLLCDALIAVIFGLILVAGMIYTASYEEKPKENKSVVVTRADIIKDKYDDLTEEEEEEWSPAV